MQQEYYTKLDYERDSEDEAIKDKIESKRSLLKEQVRGVVAPEHKTMFAELIISALCNNVDEATWLLEDMGFSKSEIAYIRGDKDECSEILHEEYLDSLI